MDVRRSKGESEISICLVKNCQERNAGGNGGTKQRAYLCAILVLSALFSSMALWVPQNVRTLLLSIGTVTGLLLTTLAYIKIYLAVSCSSNW